MQINYINIKIIYAYLNLLVKKNETKPHIGDVILTEYNDIR